MVVNVAVIAPQAYVFVEPRHFMQPVRPTTVVVNNTTIINKTVNITNVKIVNNTVINEGPHTQIIEQATGNKVRSVPVRQLRQKQEAAVVVRRSAGPVAHEKVQKNVPPPARVETQPRLTTSPSDAQRANEAAVRAQAEQAQRNAAEAKRAALVESQREAREGVVKAQQQARVDAHEAQLEAQRKAAEAAALKPASPRAKETAPTLRPIVAAHPQSPQALQQPHGKQNLTNAVKHVQQKNGKKFQPPLEKPVVAPAALEPVSR
ncbi:MAG: hypothetical protein ACXWJB_15180, partial [Limisphaerales bacterium]